MRKIQFIGYGVELPKNTVNFKEQIRYRISGDEKQISLAVSACQKALKNTNITIDDIDCIVSASAVSIQPIPCMAALIHEKIAKGTSIPALDINTTCTSFITALDTMSYLLEAGRYKRVLIVSCDVASRALNPKQKESFQLFSDGAVALVIEKTNKEEHHGAYGEWTFTHNPFSAPIDEHLELLRNKERIGDIVASQYDIVLNGYEIGGGSIRNHRADDLIKTLEIIGHSKEAIEANFGHMLKAFRFGAPPHGGIAWGLDRLIMILQNEPSIRDVIAFPKTGDSRDLLMDAPNVVDKRQLKDLGLK